MTDSAHADTCLRKIAWDSWSAEGAAVPLNAIDDPMAVETAIDAGILLRDEAGVRFQNPSVMVAAAAQYVLEHEGTTLTASPRASFERLDQLWAKEIGKENAVSGLVLAALHNSRKFDAFVWARDAVDAGIGVFHVLHVLECALPHFEYAQAAAICQLLAETYDKEKNDVFGGLLYLKLEQWLPQHPEVARDLLRIHERRPEERGCGLYAVAIHGLVHRDFDSGFDTAVRAAQSPERLIAGPALNVLGLVDYASPQRAPALGRLISILSALVKNPEHPLLGTAVTAASRLVHLKEAEASALMEEAARTHKAEVLYALSGFFFRERADLWGRPWFWPLFMHLAHAEAIHKGALDNVDHVLYRWLKDAERALKVIEFLNAWISNQSSRALQEPGLVAVFDATVHRFAEVPATLSAAITGWLLHSDDRYPMVAHSVVSKLHIAKVSNFALDAAVLDSLSEAELVFLVRRILGYLFGHEIVLPLMFSLLHTRDAKGRTFGLFVGVVRDRLGYDYPEQTLSFLRGKANVLDADPQVKELCSVLVREIEACHAAEDALPLLKEFYPSPEKIRRFSKERQRQMAEAMEEADKKSVLRQLMTEIPLKAGRRTFQKFNGKYTDVTALKGVSHSIPIPRTEIADPMGSARERYLFRRAKKGEP